MEEYSKFVGIGAGIFTAASLIPQLYKIIREKKAEDISYLMLAILLAGLCGWTWYGILKKDFPIIFTNLFSIVVNILIICFSAKFKEKR